MSSTTSGSDTEVVVDVEKHVEETKEEDDDDGEEEEEDDEDEDDEELQLALQLSLEKEVPKLDSTFVGACKMILVARKDLNMGAGKLAAQCAHAAVDLVEKLPNWGALGNRLNLFWRANGVKKVVVRVDSMDEFRAVHKSAKARNLPTTVIRDAGRTQVDPGTTTVLAILGPEWMMEDVTGHLSLY